MFNEIKNGSNFITIDEENIVKKFDRVSELIVPLLFKHNIYSVHVEHNSLVKKIIIEITKNSSELHSRRFINRNWNNNSSRSTK